MAARVRWRKALVGRSATSKLKESALPCVKQFSFFSLFLSKNCAPVTLPMTGKSSIFIAFWPLRPGCGNPSRLECDLRLFQVARYRRIAQFGRAPLLQGGGRRFDSCSAYQRCLSGVGGGWRVVLLADVGKAGAPSLASRP